MKGEEELALATEWFASWDKKDKEIFENCIDRIESAFCSKKQKIETFLEYFVSCVRESIGEFSFVLDDTARIRRFFFDNLLLILFRVLQAFLAHAPQALFEKVLSLLERLFACFQFFLQRALKKQTHGVVKEAIFPYEVASQLIDSFFQLLFPEREQSIVFPVPNFFQQVARSFARRVFTNGVAKAEEYFARLFTDMKAKDQVVCFLYRALHQRICLFRGKLPTYSPVQEPAACYLPRVEQLIDQAIGCLCKKSDLLRSFSKHRVSILFLEYVWTRCHCPQWFVPHRALQLIGLFFDLPYPFQVCTFDDIERQFRDKSSYEPLFFHFMKMKTSCEVHGLGSCVSSCVMEAAKQSFDTFLLDEILDQVVFALKRFRNFALSQEIRQWCKGE